MRNRLLKITAPLTMLAATTIPLTVLTSCNKEADPTFEIDLAQSEEWEPSEAQFTGKYTETELTNIYYDWIAAKPYRLAEEICYHEDIEADSGTLKIWINNIDVANKKLSYKMIIDGQRTDESVTVKFYLVEEFVNIPFTVFWDDDYFILKCSWTNETIKTAKDWKVYIKDEFEGFEKEYSDSSTDAQKQEALKNVIHTIDSFYMEECELKEELK